MTERSNQERNTHETDLLEVLEEEECRYRLSSNGVGRVGFCSQEGPVVLPVNYVFDGESVYFFTGEGAKLQAARESARMCLQLDGVDAIYHQGWSVLALGFARELTDPAELASLGGLSVRPWAGGARDHLVCIRVEKISGRAIRR
jgi:nitroimidazol reductase NimA-like FMN-containing flavoprotein (pyridoxamine 5'-phosphate oxidase superfamily)